MAYKSEHKGVIFIEGADQNAQIIGSVKYTKDAFYNQQLKNLDNVKDQLAEKVKKMGGNALVNFKYGQKSAVWFRSMLLAYDDNINWYGSGSCAKLDESTYSEYLEKIKKQ